MATKKSDSKADTKSSRCWPGFEPVPGKGEHEEGSCRKKPASRNGGKEPVRETSRKKQVAQGARAQQAKSKSPNASERRSVSKTATGARASASKTAASKKSSRKSSSAAKKSAGTRTSRVAAKSSGRTKTTPPKVGKS